MRVVPRLKGRQLFGAQTQPLGQFLQAEALVAAGLAEAFAQMDEFRNRYAPVLGGQGRASRIGQGL